jgi:hypothetical protein
MRGGTDELPSRPYTTVLWANRAQIFVDQQIGQNQGSPAACAVPKNAGQLIIWILNLRGTKERCSECERISQPDWLAHLSDATAATSRSRPARRVPAPVNVRDLVKRSAFSQASACSNLPTGSPSYQEPLGLIRTRTASFGGRFCTRGNGRSRQRRRRSVRHRRDRTTNRIPAVPGRRNEAAEERSHAI